MPALDHHVANYLAQKFLPDDFDNSSPPISPAVAKAGLLISSSQSLWKNIEYASQHPPANQKTGCLARLDYCINHEDRSITVRGWIFHRQHLIQQLFLSSPLLTRPVYTIHLERSDVKQIFPCFTHAFRSGFLAVLPNHADTCPDLKSLTFRAVLENGTLREGTVSIL